MNCRKLAILSLLFAISAFALVADAHARGRKHRRACCKGTMTGGNAYCEGNWSGGGRYAEGGWGSMGFAEPCGDGWSSGGIVGNGTVENGSSTHGGITGSNAVSDGSESHGAVPGHGINNGFAAGHESNGFAPRHGVGNGFVGGGWVSGGYVPGGSVSSGGFRANCCQPCPPRCVPHCKGGMSSGG